MAYDGGKEPLLTQQQEVHEPKPQDDYMILTKNIKLRRCKSAPMMEPVLQETNLNNQGQKPISDQQNPQVAVYLFIYLGISVILFYLVGNHISGVKTYGVLDSIYFCIVTMTTVGYGDLLPNSTATKLLACAFMLFGMALVGLCLSRAADCLVVNQEISLIKAFYRRREANSTGTLTEMEANKVKYKCIRFSILMVILMASGTVFLTTVEKMEIVDAFYCVCSTITTIGYGDKSFSTLVGRVFAIFWMLMSIICLAQLLFAFVELYTQSRQRTLVKWFLMDLEAADLNYRYRERYGLV